MVKENILIQKISKGKNQYRITLPKSIKADYALVKPIQLNVFKAKRKYFK